MQIKKSGGMVLPVLETTGETQMGMFDFFCDAVEGVGRAIDTAVNVVIIDGVCGTLDAVIDTVKENPVKSVAAVAVTLASGGAALACAGPIAATLGSAGFLGTASTGASISSLTGAALTNASLAALGGGALSVGGGGMAAGTVVVGVSGAATGAVAAGGVIAVT